MRALQDEQAKRKLLQDLKTYLVLTSSWSQHTNQKVQELLELLERTIKIKYGEKK
tara:strand:+ start:3021 stop:3185 length:165 start_codon:yes stop_codon:yes gene_type:complete